VILEVRYCAIEAIMEVGRADVLVLRCNLSRTQEIAIARLPSLPKSYISESLQCTKHAILLSHGGELVLACYL
jgi:hypothetical protein